MNPEDHDRTVLDRQEQARRIVLAEAHRGEVDDDDLSDSHDLSARHPELAAEINVELRKLARLRHALRAGAAPDAAVGERPGDVVGRYTLLRPIGEGGFGTVFAAEQIEPIRRTVALKVIKPGMDTREVIRRFEAERQALALMDHDGIARVLDAGATENGRPYFVMELVEGRTLTECCDTEQLGMRERLDVFMSVCEAVHYAHQKGVIHRDLKPSNILVTRHGERWMPKVIDFGIAKATESHLLAATTLTVSGAFIGTPAYMSPEQVEGSADIDIRSDLYSLGVILYELLAGTTPFELLRTAPADVDELRRLIRDADPPRPSASLTEMLRSTSADRDWDQLRIAEIADERGTNPTRLIRSVRGDLDWIVMKTLEKDRERRYMTVHDLLMDLRRHLNDEPVLAGPPSAAYRVKKFARRHRPLLAASGVIVVAVVGGLATALYGLFEAQTERRESDAVTTFVTDMFNEIDPDGPRGKDVLVRDMLDDAAQRLNEYEGQPRTRVRVLTTLGTAYFRIGDYANAITHLDQAKQDARSTAGDDSLVVGRLLSLIGQVQTYQRKPDEALTTYREARSILVRRLGDDDSESLAVEGGIGMSLLGLDRFDEAEPVLVTTLARRRETLGEEHPHTLISRNNLGGFHLRLADRAARQGDDETETRHLSIAGAEFEEVLRIRRAVHGPTHTKTLRSMDNHAKVLKRLGEFEAAEELLEFVATTSEEVLGRHPDTGRAFNNMAALYRDWKKDEPAVHWYERALLVHPKGSVGEAMSLWGMGTCLSRLERYDDAERALLDAASVCRHIGFKRALEAVAQQLAELYSAMDRPTDAQKWERLVEEIRSLDAGALREWNGGP